MFKKFKDLEKKIEELDKSLGLLKVNLIHEGGEGEGIWAVPADPGSKAKIMADSSRGDFAFVRLCNTPLGWNDLTWGGLVRVKTNGDQRPMAHLEDQKMPEIDADKANLGALVVEEIARREKRESKKNKTKTKSKK